MTLLEKIEFLMKEKGLNKRQLAISCGLSYSAVDGFFKVSYENMKLTTFKSLCTFFGVTMDSMAYDNKDIAYTADQDLNLTTEDAELIRKYNGLDASGRQMVDVVLDTALWQAESENTEKNLEKNEKTS